MRAFIFSLDAFVAFTLALFAVYTLIFFSSIPSSYQYVLTQAHYLSKDALFSSSASDCGFGYGVFPYGCTNSVSALDNIVFLDVSDPVQRAAIQKASIESVIGDTIPKQFGYSFEVSPDGGQNWEKLYDTADSGLRDAADRHATSKKKLSVSSQVVVFDYSGRLAKVTTSPYLYTSCMNGGSGGASNILLTCSYLPRSSDYLSGGGGSQIVPSTGIRVVRLTIFI